MNELQNNNITILKGKQLKIYEAQISDYICSTHHFKIYEGDLYVRNGCQDIKVDKYEFYNWIYQLAAQNGVTLMSSNCADILKEVMLRSLKFKGIPNGEEYTVFRNCCVSNLTSQIVSLPDDYFSTICVEANYVTDPVLNHPVADQFLYTISGGDPTLISLHWTYLGYCLSSDAHAKALFFLYGPSGNNGKSTELNLQKSLLSKGSVDFMPIRTLLSEFGKARLRNIRMEISADEGELNLSARDIGYLKTFSGHDDLTANVKFKEFVSFPCTSKIVISSNNNIGMAYSNIDPAFARRVVTIPYPVSIPKEQQDPYILEKLLAEKDAIATEAFRSYLALRENNYKFPNCTAYTMQSSLFVPLNSAYNAIQVFSCANCDFSDPDAFTSTFDLYMAFCAVYGSVFQDITSFSQEFYRVNVEKLEKTRKRIGGQNNRGFYGVKLHA